MSYTKNTWSKGDVVTSAKLNNMETGIKDAHYDISVLQDRIPSAQDSDAGMVLTTVANSNFPAWKELPNTKSVIAISAEEAAQIYALVEQLKTAADGATTKSYATGVPFSGSAFLNRLVTYMSSNDIVPVIEITGSDTSKNKYLSVYDAASAYASFGYTEMTANTLYEVRFFVNSTSLIVRVTSCPYTVINS